RGVLRLNLIGRRRLDVVHLMIEAGARVIANDFLGIGRPRNRAQRIRVAIGTVVAQRSGWLIGTCRAQENVEVLNQRFVLAVKRSANLRFGSSGSRRRGSSRSRAASTTAATPATSLPALGLSARSASGGCLSKTSACARLRRWRLIVHAVYRVAAFF